MTDASASEERRVARPPLLGVRIVVVLLLWALPAWLVWQIASRPELQQGLAEWQLGILVYYPFIGILMLLFVAVLGRRLPDTAAGLMLYLLATIGLAALHWWLSETATVWMLVADWACFSITIFVLAFSIELSSRIIAMARAGHWMTALFGGALNLALFVVPGILITVTLYRALYHQGLFDGGWLIQLPYLAALLSAVYADWRRFNAM